MKRSYAIPRTVNEAVGALTQSPGLVLAGGTDIYPALGAAPAPSCIVDISRVEELGGIELTAKTVRIGAGTTWASIGQAALPSCFEGLKSAARDIGSPQIQNRASIGGNLCNASPAADGLPALLALEADVELASSSGRRSMPVAEFVLGNRKTALQPGEILTAVLVPAPMDRTVSSFQKLGARRYMVISVVMVAANLSISPDGRISSAHVAVGACSPVAQRLPGLESALLGERATPDLNRIVDPGHLSGLRPISDDRASSAYRLDAALTLVRRALDDCISKAWS